MSRRSGLEFAMTLLPFATLFAAFLVFKLDALRASLSAWAVEIIVAFAYYHMAASRSLEASLWGNLAMWTGFLVLYTGQLFGQAYRSTGLLEILLESVQSLLPSWDQKGQAVALVTMVGGFIGAFNGFATYPVTIPGLVALGFDGVAACSSYLVYFSWTLPFNSLFLAPNISNAASRVPVIDVARSAGLLSIPLVFLSLLGFLKVLGFRFFQWESQALFWLMGLSNAIAIVLFTQVWPQYYIVMMIAGATLSLGALAIYGALAKRQPVPSTVGAARAVPEKTAQDGGRFRAFAPLLLGVFIVVMTRVPGVAEPLERLRFNVAAWGYAPISINIVTSAGFFIFLTALACYLFRCKAAHAGKDFVIASRRSWRSLATLCVGSAAVYLMVDTGADCAAGARAGEWREDGLRVVVSGGGVFGRHGVWAGAASGFSVFADAGAGGAAGGNTADAAGGNCDGNYDGADECAEANADCLYVGVG